MIERQHRCQHCREAIRPNQTGGWYHVETAAHRSDQRCFLYATPRSQPSGMDEFHPATSWNKGPENPEVP